MQLPPFATSLTCANFQWSKSVVLKKTEYGFTGTSALLSLDKSLYSFGLTVSISPSPLGFRDPVHIRRRRGVDYMP